MKSAALAATGALIVVAAWPMGASAEVAGGVIGCDAAGNKQVGGAVVGAVVGGIAGNKIAKHDHTTGTVVGAATGAAAGSYIGCRMQKSDAQAQTSAAAREDEARRAVLVDHDHDRYEPAGKSVPPGLAKKPHQMPPGLAKKYYGVGERLPAAYVGEPRNALKHPSRYGLRYAPAGYRWVVIGRDAYLVRTRTGAITEVARAILG